jgi:hypothetical protein
MLDVKELIKAKIKTPNENVCVYKYLCRECPFKIVPGGCVIPHAYAPSQLEGVRDQLLDLLAAIKNWEDEEEIRQQILKRYDGYKPKPIRRFVLAKRSPVPSDRGRAFRYALTETKPGEPPVIWAYFADKDMCEKTVAFMNIPGIIP